MKKNLVRLQSKFEEIVLAWFPCLVAFLLIPFAIYLPNQREFDFNLIVILPYLLLAFISFFCLLTLFLFKPPLRHRMTVVLFFLGVYLALSDTLAPVQMGEMLRENLSEPILEPLALSILDGVLALFALYCAVKLPLAKIKKVGILIVLTLFLTEIVIIAKELSFESHFENQEVATIPAPEPLNESGNIYQITFDAFSSHIFLDYLKEISSPEEFDGFIFFRKNKANFFYTWLSVASFMSGSFYQGGSLEKWLNAWRSGGLIDNLYENGYEVYQYLPERSWAHKKASYVALAGQFYQRCFNEMYHFADLWLLRLVPHYLHREVYTRNNRGLISLFLEKWIPAANRHMLPLGSAEMMKKLTLDVETQPNNGQYIYTHLYFPHAPYVLDKSCLYSGAHIYSRDEGYAAQARCAVKLMKELITKLKEEGKYDQALIIFQSDHGAEHVGPKDSSQSTMSPEIAKKISEINLRGETAEAISNFSDALLLIKPPYHSGKPLVISDRLTQLADIPATIYENKKINITPEVGISVLAEKFPENREIHSFLGFSQKNEKGINIRFDLDIFKGEINHFSYNPSDGWKIHPNIEAVW